MKLENGMEESLPPDGPPVFFVEKRAASLTPHLFHLNGRASDRCAVLAFNIAAGESDPRARL
jgi:hypothetical protein